MQLTLRGFDDELAIRIKELAEREHISMNKAVLRLLHQATGLDAQAPHPVQIGSALDAFICSWSEEERVSMDEAVSIFKEIDPEIWS
ncbi:hypothetical protein MNBD_GAMMA26-1598 [hydrothermal vent metagenome]|uniref:Uncharacterized protein n=1 Tax=hydrothermal vent metagenome TaxID=652676 RepID=A0A3B1AI07_9ZZZZ